MWKKSDATFLPFHSSRCTIISDVVVCISALSRSVYIELCDCLLLHKNIQKLGPRKNEEDMTWRADLVAYLIYLSQVFPLPLFTTKKVNKEGIIPSLGSKAGYKIYV